MSNVTFSFSLNVAIFSLPAIVPSVSFCMCNLFPYWLHFFSFCLCTFSFSLSLLMSLWFSASQLLLLQNVCVLTFSLYISFCMCSTTPPSFRLVQTLQQTKAPAVHFFFFQCLINTIGMTTTKTAVIIFQLWSVSEQNWTIWGLIFWSVLRLK